MDYHERIGEGKTCSFAPRRLARIPSYKTSIRPDDADDHLLPFFERQGPKNPYSGPAITSFDKYTYRFLLRQSRLDRVGKVGPTTRSPGSRVPE